MFQKKTTKGWKPCVVWNDGTMTWEPLLLLKESNPIKVAKYAKAHDLVKEPAFSWWVPSTLKMCDAIITAVNKRYRK
jgi:hypothetical protein